jgi:hypothetical protein
MTTYDSIERAQLEPRMLSGARWFYWIAALSILTSIISLVGGNLAFLVALGIMQMIDGMAKGAAESLGEGTKIVALVFDLIAAGVLALIGYFATKRHSWAFIVGMALYALDALLLCVSAAFAMEIRILLPIAFHAYVLYNIFSGYRACARMVEIDKAAAFNVPPPPPASVPMQ